MTNRTGYKKSKSDVLPSNWESDALENLSINGTQNGLYKPKEFYGSGFEMVHMSDIFSKRIIVDGDMQKVTLTEDELKKYRLNEGDLIFARRSFALDGVGKCSIVGSLKKPVTFESSIIRITLDINRIYPLFAFYYIESPRGRLQMLRFARQVAVSGIAGEDLRKYTLPIPSLSEQRRIAEILSTWDEAITLTEQLIAVKQRRKKALMQQLLTGRRFREFAGEEWRETHLGDIFTERRETEFVDLPLLSVMDEKGIVYRDTLDRRDTSNEDKSKYLRVCIGDIAYNTMRMWQGRTGVSKLEGIVSPAYTVCIPKTSIDVNFMGYLFKFPPMIYIFWRYSQGLVSDTLSLKFNAFAKIKVRIPGLEEQRKIATVLQACDEEIELLKQKLAALKRQKQGLMQQLLTGRVRV